MKDLHDDLRYGLAALNAGTLSGPVVPPNRQLPPGIQI
jgi:hypothetical protein